jgi:SAM-dependent methyltransferase
VIASRGLHVQMAPDRHDAIVEDPGAAVRIRSAEGKPALQLQVAATIIDVARALSRSVPPPRGAPYFCLDSAAAYDLSVLDAFCARGIFRKYEFALDLGSGLGGRARWLAARTGCRVVGVDPSMPTVAAAALLNRRAHMDEQVRFQVGRLTALPLRERQFTHVWMVDAAATEEFALVTAEAFRVLRQGGLFAWQSCEGQSVHRRDLLAALRRAGFVDLEVGEVRFAEPPHACRVARDRLRLTAPHTLPADSVWRWFRPQLQESAGVQVFARRPA